MPVATIEVAAFAWLAGGALPASDAPSATTDAQTTGAYIDRRVEAIIGARYHRVGRRLSIAASLLRATGNKNGKIGAKLKLSFTPVFGTTPSTVVKKTKVKR
jgi:hypothetical protein